MTLQVDKYNSSRQKIIYVMVKTTLAAQSAEHLEGNELDGVKEEVGGRSEAHNTQVHDFVVPGPSSFGVGGNN